MTDQDTPIIIIGGGHAAAQLCGLLGAAGLGPRVQLVCEETHLPYHRPPLSKAYLKSPDEALMAHRADTWFSDHGITVHLGDAAVEIDRNQRLVRLRSGVTLAPYGWLVLATGTRARHLPGLPEDLGNVAVVRTAADAERMRALLMAAPSVTVLGGGFIGLEVAATARALGKPVTVLEMAPRLMARSVSAELSAHVLTQHQSNGMDVRTGVTLEGTEVDERRLVALKVDGERLPVDLLVLGIGAAPETRLAEAAGLACDNGVVVDAQMRTSDDRILAIGDCTSFPAHAFAAHDSGRLRLESVQNANDQAATAAATLQGQSTAYAALPWFWSEQGPMRLQMAGLLPPGTEVHRRPGANPNSFSLLHYKGDRLVCVESVNAPMDHITARKLLSAGISPPASAAIDPATPLKNFAG